MIQDHAPRKSRAFLQVPDGQRLQATLRHE
jgi:hypothetical protein